MTAQPPSIDSSSGLKRLPALLSVVAGSADVISFLGLGGVFVAHITGNLIILAARLVDGVRVGISPILSVPVFVAMVIVTRILAARLITQGRAPLEPLLGLQFVLLAGFFAFGVISGTHGNPDAAVAVSRRCSASAGCRAALSPWSARCCSGATRTRRASARRRAAHTWPAIVGFAAGAAVGAALYAAVGIAALIVPAGGALLALAAVRAWPSIDLAPVSSINREGST